MPANRLAECQLPDLPEPFATALRQSVEFILSDFHPIGIVATGTIVRGTANANSDLDLYVVHTAAHRRRVQRFFNGVPAEIFVNPASAVRAYFVDEDRNGRRFTAHMIATGVVVFRDGPIMDELRTEARGWLEKKTAMSDFERVSTRYGIASRLEDALDLVDTDDVTATMLLAESVIAILEYACKAADGRIPRRKELMTMIAGRDSEIAQLATEFFQAASISERKRSALALADRTIGARGFFEWDSGPGPAPQ